MINRDDNPQPEEKTLRDEFAMAALTGILVHGSHQVGEAYRNAEIAYNMADAMLKIR